MVETKKGHNQFMNSLTTPMYIKDDTGKIIQKKCPKCKDFKDRGKFYPNNGSPSGLSSYCIDCRIIGEGIRRKTPLCRKQKRDTYKKNKDKTKEGRNMNTRYSMCKSKGLIISKEEFIKCYDNYTGSCEICGSLPPKDHKLNFDHSHDGGNFRGFLCGSCNRGIGMFKDDVELLKKTITYLIKNGTK